MSKKNIKPLSPQTALARSKYVIVVIVCIFSVLFGLCLLSIFKIQSTNTYKGVNLDDYAQSMYTSYEEVTAERGVITDTNGEQLAVNIATYDMYAILNKENKTIDGQPDYVADPAATANALVNVLGLQGDPEAYELFYSQLTMPGAGQVEFGTYGKSLDINQKEAIEELKLPGIHFTENETRYYPYGNFASYVLGYVTPDENGNLVGQMGVEKAFDGYLRGVDGETITEEDAAGIPVSDEQQALIKGTDGSDTQLTIDTQIQSYVQSAVDSHIKSAKDLKYDMAFTVVMDAKDGSILAAYSLPTFDPNKRDVKNYINPFTQYCYEPGSTAKPFVVATAMEEGKWDPKKVYEVDYRSEEEWGTQPNGKPNYIADWLYNMYGMKWGTLTAEEGLIYSSNVAMTRILDEFGGDIFEKYMTDKWLFGTPVNNSSMQTEACTYSPQYELDTYNTTFGQGMTANAMQMLRGYSAFANDGQMVQPHIVESMKDPITGENFYDAKTDKTLAPKQVMTTENSDAMLKALENVVYYDAPKDGWQYDPTAAKLAKSTVRVAAKTGTAQIPADGTYSSKNGFISSYMALAPAEDPQIIVYSIMVNPSTYPKVDFIPYSIVDIIDQTIGYLSKNSATVKIDPNDNNGTKIKDYTGVDINKANAELKEQGFETYVIGDGNVVTQYPPSTQIISKDTVVVLKADENFDPNKFVGMSYELANGVCKVSNWECQFDGIGTIKSFKKNSDTSYTLSTTVKAK